MRFLLFFCGVVVGPFVRSFVRSFVCLTRQIFITRVFKAKQRERERTKNETKKPGQGRFLEQ